MTVTPHMLQIESPADELAMLLVGDFKSGKSRLAATAPGNILFLEFDRRLAALRTHPNAKNIYGMEFSDDINNPRAIPSAFNDMQSVLTALERSPLLANIAPMFKPCGDKWVDTIVFDSVHTMSEAARRYILANNADVGKSFAMGQKIYRVAASYHAWGGEMEMVTGAILQARALLHCRKCAKSATFAKDSTGMTVLKHTDPGTYDHEVEPKAMNVIAILHECMEQDERSTQENPIYTGKIEVYPRRYNTLLAYFNEVWRLTREQGGVPQIHADPDGKFTQAATALGVVINTKTVPDITQVLKDAKSIRR